MNGKMFVSATAKPDTTRHQESSQKGRCDMQGGQLTYQKCRLLLRSVSSVIMPGCTTDFNIKHQYPLG